MAPGPGGAVNRNWWPGWRKDLCLFHPGCPHGPDSNGLLPSTTGVRAGLGNPYARPRPRPTGHHPRQRQQSDSDHPTITLFRRDLMTTTPGDAILGPDPAVDLDPLTATSGPGSQPADLDEDQAGDEIGRAHV